MFTFVLPPGVTLVNWNTHCELRFRRADGEIVRKFMAELQDKFEREIEGLTVEMSINACDHCQGAGRVGLTVCLACSGSGRKGFVVPGKEEPKAVEHAPTIPSAPLVPEGLEFYGPRQQKDGG
jgi:hypothetical protein